MTKILTVSLILACFCSCKKESTQLPRTGASLKGTWTLNSYTLIDSVGALVRTSTAAQVSAAPTRTFNTDESGQLTYPNGSIKKFTYHLAENQMETDFIDMDNFVTSQSFSVITSLTDHQLNIRDATSVPARYTYVSVYTR